MPGTARMGKTWHLFTDESTRLFRVVIGKSQGNFRSVCAVCGQNHHPETIQYADRVRAAGHRRRRAAELFRTERAEHERFLPMG